MDEIKYSYELTGRYEVRVIRNLSLTNYSDSSEPYIFYDTGQVQYMSFKSIEQAKQVCEMAGIQEYEIEEYAEDDHKHWNRSHTVYRSPIAKYVMEALSAQQEQRKIKDQEERAENRKKLEAVPKEETVMTFSGKKTKLIRIISFNEERGKVWSRYYLLENDEEPKRDLYLSNYFTKSKRIRKNSIREDFKRWEIPDNEIELFINNIENLRKQEQELENLKI